MSIWTNMMLEMRYRVNSAVPALMPGAIHRLSNRDTAAVTIDDAPSGDALDRVLDLARERRIRLTFFLRGDMTERHQDIAARIADDGHEIGSHGYRHISPMILDTEQFNTDLTRSLEVIKKVCGIRPKLYRPPYGRLNPARSGLPTQLGCHTVLWNRMPDDWDPSVSPEIVGKRLRAVEGGDIVVLHEHPGRGDLLLHSLRVLADTMEKKQLTTMSISESEGLS